MLLSKALVYRTESYISVATITDVVYIQQNQDKNKKKRRKYEESISEYGYLLSCYEQIGYLIRWYIKYSVQHLSNFYENKKYNKYIKRLNNALDKYKKYSNKNKLFLISHKKKCTKKNLKYYKRSKKK